MTFIKPIPPLGVDLVIGESQGWKPLPVRYDLDPNITFNFGSGHNTITTYWKPDAEAIQDIIAGKPIVLRFVGAQQQPVTMSTHDPMVS